MALKAPAGWQLWYDARPGVAQYYLYDPVSRRIFDVGKRDALTHGGLQFPNGGTPPVPSAFPNAEHAFQILANCTRVGGDAV